MTGATYVALGEANRTARIRSFIDCLPEGNLAIVAGKGTAASRPQIEVGATTASGIARREIYVNASDCSTQGSMEDRGREELENSKNTSIEIDLVRQDMYGTSFILGDIVAIDAGVYGAYSLQVIEAETKYTSNSKEVKLTLGSERKGIMRVIRDSITSNTQRRV